MNELKRLHLRRETIRHLTPEAMRGIAGASGGLECDATTVTTTTTTTTVTTLLTTATTVTGATTATAATTVVSDLACNLPGFTLPIHSCVCPTQSCVTCGGPTHCC